MASLRGVFLAMHEHANMWLLIGLLRIAGDDVTCLGLECMSKLMFSRYNTFGPNTESHIIMHSSHNYI